MPPISVEQAFQTALAFYQAGQIPAAEALFRQIVTAEPTRAEAWHWLGLIADATGRHEEAIQRLSRAIALTPQIGAYHSDVGIAHRKLGRVEEAIRWYRQALALQPDLPAAHSNLSEAFITLGRFDEAIASLRRVLELLPGHSATHNNLAAALTEIGSWDEAIVSAERALVFDPQLTEARNNLGRAYTELERYDEAIAVLEVARKQKPDSAGTYKNLGVALFRGGRFEAAAVCYREWVARHPADATAHRSLGQVLLCQGRFAEGWPEFEWRLRDPDAAWVHRQFAAPLWNGQPMPGATLFLHAEQGFGDAIHFVRYLPLAVERSGARRVIVECPPKLERLLRQSVAAPVEVVVRHEGPDVPGSSLQFDQHVPMMSLPFVLRHFEPLAMPAPYLRADAESRAAWRERLGPASCLRVGLAWAGSAVHVNDRRRSIAAARLAPLLSDHPNVQFHNLQVEPRGDEAQPLRNEGLIDLTEHLTDFADTAALVSELDLVISVDTAIIHLAGALGRPVWTLLPLAPDWRWGLEREDTPWYPTMRLFRQERPGDWEGVIHRVSEALRPFVEAWLGLRRSSSHQGDSSPSCERGR